MKYYQLSVSYFLAEELDRELGSVDLPEWIIWSTPNRSKSSLITALKSELASALGISKRRSGELLYTSLKNDWFVR